MAILLVHYDESRRSDFMLRQVLAELWVLDGLLLDVFPHGEHQPSMGLVSNPVTPCRSSFLAALLRLEGRSYRLDLEREIALHPNVRVGFLPHQS